MMLTPLPFWLLLSAGAVSAYDQTTSFARFDQQAHRALQSPTGVPAFVALTCNQPACRAGSFLWSSQNYNIDKLVTIPCGSCVTLDVQGDLHLAAGLDVQGALVIPDGTSVTVTTPFVRVQGFLNVSSTGMVSSDPPIKFILIGNLTSKFVPVSENAFACTFANAVAPLPCDAGIKSFAVAGGQVDIRGLPTACKTWVLLEDVIPQSGLPQAKSYSVAPKMKQGCAAVVEEDSFDSADTIWTGGAAASSVIRSATGAFLRVSNRTFPRDDGPTLDLMPHRDCFIPGQTYLFSAHIRLLHPGRSNGSPATCDASGNNCLALRSVVRLPSGPIAQRKGTQSVTDAYSYGRWFDFSATFVFDADELDPAATSHVLRLSGPEADVDIDVDDVVFALNTIVPDPTNVCGSNLILNGNAEGSPIHPYPMVAVGSGRLTVRTIGGSRVFRVENRQSDTDSIAQYLDAPGCIVAGGLYRMSAKVRVYARQAVTLLMVMQIYLSGGSFVRIVAGTCSCNPSTTIECNSDFVIQEEYSVESIRISFETVNASSSILDVDDWSLILVQNPITSILVQARGVAGCWGRGAEILITSHTTNFESSQLRRIGAPLRQVGSSMVQLILDKYILPTVTNSDGDGFAVEVALLSRNVRFEGEADPLDHLLGGHFMVMNTPMITQRIEGVEFLNFGRQGELGRYPIHFHLCADVNGSVVSKNSIRESNQRCVVVHGTYNLRVAENVAYENRGHCFMVEDGGEVNNTFIRNLGSNTRAASRIVRPFESDARFPATFWCSNPANMWIGNVAAGSVDSGFWFELQDEVRPPTLNMELSKGMIPRRTPLRKFLNNVAHSNGRHGLRTYPIGYFPSEVAVFEGLKSYKNRYDGVFFHLSDDLRLEGGVLADNRVQADFDRSDHIQINGTRLVGTSERFRQIMMTQQGVYGQTEEIIGIEIHDFAANSSLEGATIANVQFEKFGNRPGVATSLIRIDGRVKWVGNFDYWTTVQGISIDEDVTPFQFDFRAVAELDVPNAFIVDRDSTMAPSRSSVTGVSTVVADSAEITAFLDLDKCLDFRTQGYWYCTQTCLRAVTFATSPAETNTFELLVSSMANPDRSFLYPGRYFYELDDFGLPDDIANTGLRKYRYFAAALPPGLYTAEFIDKSTGKTSWPVSAITIYEQQLCEHSLNSGDVQLIIPPASNDECIELIRNGDAEASNTSFPYWLQYEAGIELVKGAGISGSNAIADIQTAEAIEVGQFVDVRCLRRRRQYLIQARVRLEGSDGMPFICDTTTCPTVRMRVTIPSGNGGESFVEYTPTIASAYAAPTSTEGWNLLHGVLSIDAKMSSGVSAVVFVERDVKNVRMYLDNFSMKQTDSDCRNLVFNGDFSTRNSLYWDKVSRGNASLQIELVSRRNPALKLESRALADDGIFQEIKTGCMTEGGRYSVSARVQMTYSDGTPFSCNPNDSKGDSTCPRLRLRSTVDLGLKSQKTGLPDLGFIGDTDHGSAPDGWKTVSGFFFATAFDEQADQTTLSIEGVPKGIDLVIDDVVITSAIKSCAELLMNGDFELYQTIRFWRPFYSDTPTKLELVVVEGSNALLISGRNNFGDGPSQLLDPRCLLGGTRWILTGKLQVLSTGEYVSCDPEDTRIAYACPPVRITGFKQGALFEDVRYPMTTTSAWSSTSLNDFEVAFEVSDKLASCDRVVFSIRNFNVDWDIIIDDLSIRPAE